MKNSAQTIVGVELKLLTTYPDDRGFFREIIRSSDPFFQQGFAQWSHSKMALNTVKAWHFHHKQYDWWYVPIGLVRAVLIDNRSESPTFGNKQEFILGDKAIEPGAQEVAVKIPPGVLHGCKVMTDSAHLFYITSQIYDPEDEGRIPYNDPAIDFQWGNDAELIVSPRDKVPHTPSYKRELLTKV